MKSYKYIYHHDGEIIYEETIFDSITYKLKLETEKTFYRLEDGEWMDEDDFMLPITRRLELKLKLLKMVNDEVHYVSTEVIEDFVPKWDEW